jgi:hypothetical protein
MLCLLQLDKAAADAVEFKTGFDKYAADAAEYKAGYDKVSADAAEFKAGYDKLLVDSTEQKAQVWCLLLFSVELGCSGQPEVGVCVVRSLLVETAAAHLLLQCWHNNVCSPGQ